MVLRHGENGETYCIGGENEITNLSLALKICELMDELVKEEQFAEFDRFSEGSFKDQIAFVTDRPGHDFRYAINPAKIKKIGWEPSEDFEKNLIGTIRWYLTKYSKKREGGVTC